MHKVLVVYEDACIGLTVVRALGSEGVPVAGILINGGFSARSRYLKEKIRLAERAELTGGKLREAVDAFRPKYIMAVGEKDMVHLNGLRAALPSGVRMLFPDEPVLEQAVKKPATLRIAANLGIDCPRTYFDDADEELNAFLDGVEFPVVMKLPYSKPEEIPERLWMKYCYADTPEAVQEVMGRYRGFGLSPLVQEYVSGRGVGVELCRYQGEIVGAFQHERIHELPLGGGASTYCRSVVLEEDLLERATALLRAMRWEGVAMVEFKRDVHTGRTVLMEVNGRFWGSLFLAVASGVNFPYLLYRTMGEGEMVRPTGYRVGLRGKREGRELRWAADAILLRRDLPPEGMPSRVRCLRDFIGTCAPGVVRDIWSWSDLMPGLWFRLGLLPSLLWGFVKWVRKRIRAVRVRP